MPAPMVVDVEPRMTLGRPRTRTAEAREQSSADRSTHPGPSRAGRWHANPGWATEHNAWTILPTR